MITFIIILTIYLFIGIIFYLTVSILEINAIIDSKYSEVIKKDELLKYFEIEDLIIGVLFWFIILVIGGYNTYKEYKETIK